MTARAEEPVFSGPQAGERITPFKVRGVYDEAAGKELDFVTRAGGKPLLLVFVHEANRPSIAMTRVLMDYATGRTGDGLECGVVWLANADDLTAAEQFLKRARHAMPARAPVGIAIDGKEGPGAYGLNRNVTLTVLVAKGDVVTANFALVQPSLPADVPRVLGEVVKLVGGKVPTLAELGAPGAMPARRGAGEGKAEAGDENLRTVLGPVIRRDATPEEVDRAAAAVEAYVKDRPAARAQLGRAARTIVESGKLTNYGTPRAQEHLKTWAEPLREGGRRDDCPTPRRRPRPRPTAMTVLLLAASLAFGLDPADRKPVDFDTKVIPVLTRAGCNTGSCHGAAVGRGGFRLSLFGSDAARDYDAIVRELEGRRVDLARPDESLVLAKPSGRLDHEGGVRLKPGGAPFERLRDWLRKRARLRARRLVQFTVEPPRAVVGAASEPVALRATARFDDGATDDVTGVSVFQAADPDAVEIRTERGRASARVIRAGQNVVVARFLDRVVPVELMLPLGAGPVDHSGVARVNFVDDEVLALLEVLQVPVSPPARRRCVPSRVSLDLAGRLPDLGERSGFLADPDPDKRTKVVDRLLASDGFVEFWTYRLGEWLRVGAAGQDRDGAWAFQGWLRQQVAHRTPFDELVRALLTAEGETRRVGPANFYAVAGDARSQAEYVAQVFLGARLQCANCHNHPLDRWTQDDYHGLAALFARVERDRDGVIRLAARGEVTHPATGEPAQPRIPGDRFLEATPGRDLRVDFSEWLTAPVNPFLARAIVELGSGGASWAAVSSSRPTTSARPTLPPTPRFLTSSRPTSSPTVTTSGIHSA